MSVNSAQPAGRTAQPAQEDEGDVETIVEGVIFRASARPLNWGARGRPVGGGGKSKPEAKILPVRLRVKGISREPPIAKKTTARVFPSWACTKCTYQHDIKSERRLRKCIMCGVTRRHGADVAISAAVAPRPPPPGDRLPRPSVSSSASSTAHGHSFMCEGAAAGR